jgi:hypothetical protein
MSSALQDLLSDDLTENDIRVVVQGIFDINFVTEDNPRSKTLGRAKSLLEFYDLVRQAIDNYETRAGATQVNKVIFTEEEPDADSDTETITFSLISREPGSFSQGSTREGDVRNRRPIQRAEGEDSENPGYRYVETGFWYDNIVRFTCWARTNKAANARAEWFEDFMENYLWWFRMQGVSRLLFEGRRTDIVTVVDNNKWYGRPIDFFVRTEKIRTFSEKKIEQILIKLAVKEETNT